jgi:hypothetical protein
MVLRLGLSADADLAQILHRQLVVNAARAVVVLPRSLIAVAAGVVLR